MSDTPVTSRKPASYTLAVVLSSLVIGLPIFVGRMVEAILDTTNPANVDVTQPLAYLTEILTFGFGSLGVLLIVLIILFGILDRRARTLDAIALPLLIFAVQVVVGVLTLLLSGLTN